MKYDGSRYEQAIYDKDILALMNLQREGAAWLRGCRANGVGFRARGSKALLNFAIPEDRWNGPATLLMLVLADDPDESL